MSCLNCNALEGFMPKCLGWREDLCGCCGNCNLCCYASLCPSCYLSDLKASLPNSTTRDWWVTFLTLMICPGIYILIDIFDSLFDVHGNVDYVLSILWVLSYVVMVVMGIFIAKDIAQSLNQFYEDCSIRCCLVWTFCTDCHMIQFGRELERYPDYQDRLMLNRPDMCKCCNCWIVELGVDEIPYEDLGDSAAHSLVP